MVYELKTKDVEVESNKKLDEQSIVQIYTMLKVQHDDIKVDD